MSESDRTLHRFGIISMQFCDLNIKKKKNFFFFFYKKSLNRFEIWQVILKGRDFSPAHLFYNILNIKK